MKYLCGRCIHIDVCFIPRSTGCVEECKYFKEMPNHLLKQTNEEWFCQLPTEQKARWLYDHYVNAMADECYGRPEKTLYDYQKWLVGVHRGIDGTKID